MCVSLAPCLPLATAVQPCPLPAAAGPLARALRSPVLHAAFHAAVRDALGVHAVGAGGFQASPQFGNVRGGGAPGQPRPPSARSNSGATPSSAKRHGTPVSPLGMPITAPAQFPPIQLADGPRTPTRALQSGTPPAADGSQSHPFSWSAEAGNSVPLHSPHFTDAAHKAVHDEVLKVRFGPLPPPPTAVTPYPPRTRHRKGRPWCDACPDIRASSARLQFKQPLCSLV